MLNIKRYQIPSVPKLLLSILIPILACSIQWALWLKLPPLTWLLFYPAVFFSAATGGLVGGVIATILACLLGVYFFIEPQFTWEIGSIKNYYSMFIFVSMGLMFSLVFDRYHRAMDELKQRSNLEQEVQQSRLKLSLDAAKAGLWEWNLITNQYLWSESLWRLLGLVPNSCEPGYAVWMNSVHSEDKATVDAALKLAIEDCTELNLEWRSAQSFQGQEQWLFSQGQPELNAKGELVLYRGIVLDISARKAIEQQLKDREEQLNFALNTVHAGVWERSLKSRTVKRSLLHDEIFGYESPRSDWSTKIFLDHVIAEDRESVVKSYRSAAVNHRNIWQIDCRIRRADGAICWISSTAAHKFDEAGEPIALVGIIQDITERKEADARQRYDEIRYKVLIDQAAPDAMFVHDHKGNFLEVNRQACLSLGYSKTELLGMNVVDLEQDFDLAKAQTQWNLITPGETKILHGHHRHKEGHQFPVEVNFGLMILDGQRQYLALVRDISMRIKLEQALKEKQRLLIDTQSVAHIGSWMFDIKTGKIAWSEETFRLYGLSPETGVAPGMDQFLGLLHPDDRALMQNWCEDCIAGKQPAGLEIRTAIINDEQRWLLGIGKLETDSNGEPFRLFGTVQDITASKRMSSELQRWADAFYYCTHGLIIGNPDTKCIETCNPAFVNMLGAADPKVLEGKPILSLYPADLVEQTKAHIQDADKFGRTNYDSKYLRLDGSQFDVNVNLVSVKNAEHKVVYRVATIQDISARKQAETALQEAAVRTQAILDTVVDGIITIDKRGNIETFNPAAERIFGYAAEEVIGTNLNRLMPDSFSRQHDSTLDNCLAGSQEKNTGIGQIVEGRRKDGSTFPLDLAVSETQLGEKCIFTGIVRDITEREVANDKLKAALSEKEVLLKEVYHRVKNNLQVVSSLINLQARNVKNEEALNLLKQSADRIKAMALLHEKLYQAKDLAKIDFRDYVESLADSLLYSFGLQTSQITINIRIGGVFLDLDTAIPCGLIINELLSNALKHAFPENRQGSIDISFSQVEDEYQLVISDNGIGLPNELDLKKCKSLGLQLVTRLTKDQLYGQLLTDFTSGTSFIIRFKNLQ